MIRKMFCLALTLPLLSLAPSAQALDEKAAEKLARKSGCLRCHAPNRDKDGDSMKKIAARWKGKEDAVQKLYEHVTSNPTIEIVAGRPEEHKSLKTDDEAEIKNVIRWYLSF